VAQLSSKTSLRGAPAGRPRLSVNRLGKRPANQSTYVKVNRFNGNVNRCFSERFVIGCIVSSLYLQTEVGGRISRRDESRLKIYSGLTVYG
jgi:hypothetical protein